MTSVSRRAVVLAALAAASVLPAVAQDKREQKFPDVVDVKVTTRGAGAFDFAVTISSPYDTAQRYADAFRVLAPDGRQLGELVLLHDHADEQPFTRSLTGVAVPAGIASVVVEARDQKNGYGGKTKTVALPGR